MARYTIDDTTLTALGDAVRGITFSDEPKTLDSMIQTLQTTTPGFRYNWRNHMVNGKWQRPANYPDIDSLIKNIPDTTSIIYLTYDLTLQPGWAWIGIRVWLESGDNRIWYADRGHIENGVFVVDETHTLNHSDKFQQVLDPNNGDIQLWRISSALNITGFGFCNNANSGNIYPNWWQCCVDRAGYLNYAVTQDYRQNTNTGYVSFSTAYLEHDNLDYGRYSTLTHLQQLYAYSYSLQETNCGKWKTDNWTINSLYLTFANCRSLVTLDLSGWNTENWPLISLREAFAYMWSIRKIDVTGWKTTNWALESMHSTFSSNQNMVEMPGWAELDMSEQPITTMIALFRNCRTLTNYPIFSWDLSSAEIITFQYLFEDNYNIKEIDWSKLAHCDFSTITDLRSMYSNCNNLITIKNSTLLPSLSTNFQTPNLPMLMNYDGYACPVSHSYSSATSLTIPSLVNILNSLPTISTTQTITLGANNLAKLTADQIAIATDKGWTVA